MFREDVKVTMASSGLYDWLLKVVNESGDLGGGEEGEGGMDGHAHTGPQSHGSHSRKKGEDEKSLLGETYSSISIVELLADVLFEAIDALALDYGVKFPLSLVISRKTILRYQLIFRFLLHLKHVEQSLSSMWIEHKTAPWRKPTRAAPPATSRPPSAAPPSPSNPQSQLPNTDWHTDFQNWRKRVFLLRARMLAFVQQILAFATFEVLEPNWRKLEERLNAGKVETVDQLLRDHVDFLDTCLKECMLTSSKLLKVSSSSIRDFRRSSTEY